MLTSIKGEINSNTIIVGDFKSSVTPMDRSTKQKISKETQALNDTMDQVDLIDIYRAFHPKIIDCTFFPQMQVEYSPVETTSCPTSQGLVNIKIKLKSLHASFLITMM